MVRMGSVANDMLFYNVNMDLRSYVYSREESIQQSQCPNVGRTKIQDTSKQHFIINLLYFCFLFNHISVYYLLFVPFLSSYYSIS